MEYIFNVHTDLSYKQCAAKARAMTHSYLVQYGAVHCTHRYNTRKLAAMARVVYRNYVALYLGEARYED